MEIIVLEDKKIKIEPIVRRRAFFPKGHDGEHTYTGCHKDYVLPFDGKKRAYVNPFLKEGEQAQFEKLLNQEPGSLNLFKFPSKFWGDFSLSLTKDGDTLNLNNPVDALYYRVLLVNPRFANNENQKSNPKCDFVLIDERVKEEAKTDLARKKEEAIDEFHKIKKSKQKLYDVLRLLNKKPDKDATIEALKAKVLEVIEEPSSAVGTTNISHFLRAVNDPLMSLKLFVLDAVEIGEITYTKDGYKINETGELLGKHLEQAVNYFNSKDADAMNRKAIIEQRLKG